MLSQNQVELIHQEIDGANTPEGSAAFRSLVERDPEARALAAELRRVAELFGQVGEREAPPHLKRTILDALPQPVRASPRSTARRGGSNVSMPISRASRSTRSVLSPTRRCGARRSPRASFCSMRPAPRPARSGAILTCRT